ncbi:hypothetical protein ElyMa_000344100 [Elysia marginata]|uniref:Ig-like domain-containing protein n=1 Tax=Elysia marginata TaxID=1093978 RepID=A0AAV4FDP2_9GAST|nr:hypothetical protein ElyMa_000344100 [Elysia marginata]
MEGAQDQRRGRPTTSGGCNRKTARPANKEETALRWSCYRGSSGHLLQLAVEGRRGRGCPIDTVDHVADISSATAVLLDSRWQAEEAGGSDVVKCYPYSCGGRYRFDFPTNISSTRSTLTISSVSRVTPFNMETKWTCNPCSRSFRTVCDKLQVYAKSQNPSCTVNENTGSGGMPSVTVTCSTSKVYPEAKCSFYRTTNGGNSIKIIKTPVYSHITIPATASTPVYYKSRCSVSVSVQELGEGTHSFLGYIYPDVTGGSSMVNGSSTDKTVTLSFPQVSHSCLTSMEQGYFIGKSTRCTCRATSDGYPRGSAQWYKGGQTVGSNGDLDITYNKNSESVIYPPTNLKKFFFLMK